MKVLNGPGNPITGSTLASDLEDEQLPFEILERMKEIDENFETQIFVKKRKKETKQIKKSNKFLNIKGELPFCIHLPEKTISMSGSKKEWEQHKKQVSKEIDAKTTDIISVNKKSKHAFINKLDQHQRDFETFFLHELSPLESAFEPSLDNVKQILELITKSEVDTGDLGTFRAMLRDVLYIKALEFFADKANLSESQQAILNEKYFRPKEFKKE